MWWLGLGILVLMGVWWGVHGYCVQGFRLMPRCMMGLYVLPTAFIGYTVWWSVWQLMAEPCARFAASCPATDFFQPAAIFYHAWLVFGVWWLWQMLFAFSVPVKCCWQDDKMTMLQKQTVQRFKKVLLGWVLVLPVLWWGVWRGLGKVFDLSSLSV